MDTLNYGDNVQSSPCFRNNRKINHFSEWESDEEIEPSYRDRLEYAPTKQKPPPGRFDDIQPVPFVLK